jgi:hypothetical protein
MSDAKSAPQAVQPVGVTRSTDFKDVYANQSRLGVSPFDFTMTFGRIIDQSIGRTTVEDQAVIRMSPQQFKSFIDAANKTLSSWEEIFGIIPITAPTINIDTIRSSMKNLKEFVDKTAT